MKIDHYPSCSDAIEREQRRAHSISYDTQSSPNSTSIEIREMRDDQERRYRETQLRDSQDEYESKREYRKSCSMPITDQDLYEKIGESNRNRESKQEKVIVQFSPFGELMIVGLVLLTLYLIFA